MALCGDEPVHAQGDGEVGGQQTGEDGDDPAADGGDDARDDDLDDGVQAFSQRKGDDHHDRRDQDDEALNEVDGQEQDLADELELQDVHGDAARRGAGDGADGPDDEDCEDRDDDVDDVLAPALDGEDAVGDVGGPGQAEPAGGNGQRDLAVFGAHDRVRGRGGLCVGRVLLGGRVGRGGRVIGCGSVVARMCCLPGSRCVGCGGRGDGDEGGGGGDGGLVGGCCARLGGLVRGGAGTGLLGCRRFGCGRFGRGGFGCGRFSKRAFAGVGFGRGWRENGAARSCGLLVVGERGREDGTPRCRGLLIVGERGRGRVDDCRGGGRGSGTLQRVDGDDRRDDGRLGHDRGGGREAGGCIGGGGCGGGHDDGVEDFGLVFGAGDVRFLGRGCRGPCTVDHTHQVIDP